MITRALTINSDPEKDHDWTFGKGKQSYFRREAAVAQSIMTRLMSFLGDCFFDINAGLDWWQLMGGKDRAALLVQVRSVILGTEGVIRVSDLDVTFNSPTRNIHLSYKIDTLYSFSQTGVVEISSNV